MQITLTRPDDWHLHLRDGGALVSVLAHSARSRAANSASTGTPHEELRE